MLFESWIEYRVSSLATVRDSRAPLLPLPLRAVDNDAALAAAEIERRGYEAIRYQCRQYAAPRLREAIGYHAPDLTWYRDGEDWSV